MNVGDNRDNNYSNIKSKIRENRGNSVRAARGRVKNVEMLLAREVLSPKGNFMVLINWKSIS